MKKMASILSVVAVLVSTYVAFPQERVEAALIGDRAPNLDIKVLAGRPVDLQRNRGRNVTIVEFWATWCAPCRYSASHLSSLQRKYGDKGLVVVGISDEDEALVKSFMKDGGAEMNYTVAVDLDQNTTSNYMAAFNVNSIPHAFLVDRSGHIVWHGNPILPALEETLVSILSQNGKSSSYTQSGHASNGSDTKKGSASRRSNSGSGSK